MKITDLRIGDIVCNKRTKYPMKVVGIYEDGTIYLDFEGNEGDVFEENCKDIEFVEKEPVEAEYNKCYYNEGTDRVYKTLEEAKNANVVAHVYEWWLLLGEMRYVDTNKEYKEWVGNGVRVSPRIICSIRMDGVVVVGFQGRKMS